MQLTDLALCIINDSATYQKRLELARAERDGSEPGYRIAAQWGRLVHLEAVKYHRHFDAPTTARDALRAAVELRDYYADHIKEVDEP